MRPSVLSCMACGAVYPLTVRIIRCGCGGLLDVVVDTGPVTVRGGTPRQRLRRQVRSVSDANGRDSGVWRFKQLVLPDIPDSAIVSRNEGNTPLYRFPKVNDWVGIGALRCKHEGFNPTGSFKDRGMTVAVSWAKHRGARRIACASTGNTAASVASYASAAGIDAVILIPEDATAVGKVAQALAYGARTVMVRGDFDAALRILLESADELGLSVMNSVNPFRLQGQQSIMFEMLDQLGWQAPDWVVVPGGNLGNTSAFGRALHDAHALGLIANVPRLAVVQAEGANPFYRSSLDGWREHHMTPETIATAIRIGAPVNHPKAVRAVGWTDGTVVQVSDREIMDAKAVLDSAGVGAEPASCASIAGAKVLATSGVIVRDASVVAVLTGHFLKDPGATLSYHKEGLGAFANRPVVIDPTTDALIGVLGG